MKMIRILLQVLRGAKGPKFAASFEWPAYCDGFNPQKNPELKALKSLLPVQTVVDGCAYGLVSRHGRPMKKPWRVLSSCAGMAQILNKRCPGHSAHDRVQGSDTAATEKYTPGFVAALTRGLLTRPTLGHGHEVLLTDPAESPSTPALMTAIKTLHSNLGHPSSRALARAIRLTGGSDEAVAAALAYRCPTCVRLKEPKPVNPAKLNDKFNNFSDLVCIDLFTLADTRGKPLSFVNCVDKATGYQLVAPVESKRPDEVFRDFKRTWLIPIGIHDNQLSDNSA